MAKRIFAFVLVLAMLVSLMPQVTVGVSAEGAKAPGTSEWCDHTSHEGWTEWGDDESEWTTLPTGEGKFFLSHDVTLNGSVTVSKNIHLCLNDHTITQTKTGSRHFYLDEGKGITFSLYDCGTNGKLIGGSQSTGSSVNVTRTNTFKMYGGTITGNNSTGDAVIYVQAATSNRPTGGVFNMYGGEISGNKVKNGVVYGAGGGTSFTNSQVNIYGGTIKDNEVTGSGGAIYVKSQGSLHVENATITGNKAATAGSAIYAEGNTPICIKNTTITGNIGTNTSNDGLTDGWSAAVYLCGSNNSLTVSGKVVISGNTTSSADIKDVMFKNDLFDSLLVDELTAGSDIVFKTRVTTAEKAGDVIEIAQGGTQNGLWQSEWVTYVDATGATKSITYGTEGFYFVEGHYHGDQKYVEWSETAKLPKADDNGVGYYLKDNVTVTSTSNKAKVTTGTLHLCLNGKTVSQNMTDVIPSNSEASDIFRVDGGSLYMSDCTTVYDEDGYFVSGGKITGGMKLGNGAALYINNAASVVEVTGVEFYNNENTQASEGYGGAAVMARKNTTPAKFTGCKFADNKSTTGGAGAIALRESGKVTAEKCLFTGNNAKYGGAIYCIGATLVVKDSKFTNNTATNVAAIDVLGTSDVTIESCEITGNSNTSPDGYGAVNLANGNSVVRIKGETTIYNNLNKDGKQQNLHLQYSTTTDIDYDVSGLTAGSKVGISLFSTRFTDYPYFSTTGMTSNPGYCISDHEDYEVKLNETTTRLELVEKSDTPPTPPADSHTTHKLCNDASCTAHGEAVTFEAWGDDTDEVGLPKSGNYYLYKDINVSAATSLNGNLNLCLNGKTITQTGNARIYTINTGFKLAITDCAEAYTGDTYTGGLITGGKHNTGSAVYVTSGTTFELYGGRIANCGPVTTTSAQTGAAVFLHSANSAGATFNMYGGEITECGGEMNWGGAVSNGGGNAGKTVYVNIYGGKIFGNTAMDGAAIRLQTDGVATIYGGEIYGNNAANTGGAILLNKGTTLNLQGGNIHDNTAAVSGGAIQASATASQITLSGAPSVQNNKVGAAQNNLYLDGDVAFEVGALTSGALIGLSRGDTRTTEVVSTNTVDAATMDYFTNDNTEDYVLEQLSGYVALSQKPVVTDHMHNVCNDTTCAAHGIVPYEKWEKTDSLPPSGNWYLAYDVELDAVASPTGALNLCLNGKTITQKTAKSRVMNVTGGVTVTISDCGEGQITGGTGTYGVAISVRTNSTLNLYGGTITGNERTDDMGAEGTVYVQASTASASGGVFNMYGGEISGNKVVRGGAVSLADSKTFANPATFNMYGGVIKNNEAVKVGTGGGHGGAVQANAVATINIQGGQITGNKAANNGGVIYMGGAGTITVANTKITGNEAANSGGVIYMANKGVLSVSDAEITGNESKSEAGAIYASEVQTTITNTQIKGNTAKNGSAIAAYGGSLTLDNAKIENNHATSGYGALNANHRTSSPIVITLKGDTTVTGNTVGVNKVAQNMYLRKSGTGVFYDVSALTDNAKIGLINESGRTQERVSTAALAAASELNRFASDDADYIVGQDAEGYLVLTPKPLTYDHPHKLCNDAGCKDHANVEFARWEKTDTLPNEGSWYLANDVKLSLAHYNNYGISGELNLCLNGHTVTAYEGKRLMMTTKGGTLNLTDCSVEPGMLTGGTQTWGAAVNINAGSTFNMYGGKISGNKNIASSGGIGAIYVQGAGAVFNMYGGEISGNESASGTIYSAPSITGDTMQINLYGGTIENNTSIKVKNSEGKNVSTSGRGGAIYANGNTKIVIDGGKIKDNVAEADGGGILATGNGTVITMDSGEISGNKATNGGGLITLNRSEFVMNGGKISGNETSSNGAGMYISTNTGLVMNGGIITGNTANNGAGFYALRSPVSLNGGEISGNVARNRAGGFAASGAQVEVGKVTISGNTAKEGGAAYINRNSATSGGVTTYYPSVVNINEGALFTGNKADTNCGGILIANDEVVVTMNGGEISKNISTNGAGVMTWKGSTFVMKGGKITNHNIKGSGGGLYISTGSTFKMEGGSISNNTAKTGGGAYFLRSQVELKGGTIGYNYAKEEVKWTNGAETKSGGSAGGFYVSGSQVDMRGTSVTGNKADSNGGGIVMGRASYKENGVTKYDLVKVNIYGGVVSGNVSGASAGGMLMQSEGTVVNMYGGTFTKNTSAKSGGGIYVSTKTTLNMTGGRVVENHSETTGGGIFVYKSTANITGGELNSNTATTNGGNLISSGGTAVANIKNIKLYGGVAKTAGCFVVQTAGSILNVENCEIYDNQTETGHGGAVYVSNKAFGNFTNCKFFDNHSANFGGAVLVNNFANASFTGCEFYDNFAVKQGGAVWCSVASNTTIDDCHFYKNASDGRGGALVCKGNLTLKNSVVENNTSAADGGGVYTDANTTTGSGIMDGMVIENTIIRNNTATLQGGGMYIYKGCRVEIYDSEITGNTAGAEGGAMWVYEDLELHNTSITDNTSGGEGYAVYMNDAMYDGHSYFTSRNKLSGNVVIKDNNGGDLWMGPDVVFAITADGLGDGTHIELTLDSGVVTNRILGAYHYEGGSQVYTITSGDRSITDPEYDASLVPGAEDEETKANTGDIVLYVGIGVFVIAIIAVAVLLITKKKKAGKTAEEVTNE